MVEYPILAIDYGEKHFGLAYSDTNGLLASPLEVLTKGRKTSTEEIINQILEIAKEYRIKTILLGSPQVFIKSHEKTERKISKFEKILQEKTELPILKYDESFSTTRAQNMLTSTGQNTKRTRKKIDKVAAAVFLQEFLNSNK